LTPTEGTYPFGHFIAVARLVYVKYTAAIAISNCAQIDSIGHARSYEIGSHV
jgi:hypothetical protein